MSVVLATPMCMREGVGLARLPEDHEWLSQLPPLFLTWDGSLLSVTVQAGWVRKSACKGDRTDTRTSFPNVRREYLLTWWESQASVPLPTGWASRLRLHGFQPHFKLGPTPSNTRVYFLKLLGWGYHKSSGLNHGSYAPIAADIRSLTWFTCAPPQKKRMYWLHISTWQCWVAGPNERLLSCESEAARTSLPITECFRLWAQSCMLPCPLSSLPSISG